jgi:hypothetical protein
LNKNILDLENLDVGKELKNIKKNDKAAKIIIKTYCEENGNKLDYDMQLELIEELAVVNKRKAKLVKLLKELKIRFSFSHVRDEKGYKYIIVRV